MLYFCREKLHKDATMSCILHIETSTKVCSVALSQDGVLLTHAEDMEGPSHAVSCGKFVEEALSFAESHAIPLDAVAVSQGPGSYTGLRIGVSMAKGVCYGRGVPLIAVPTLQVLCVPLLIGKQELDADALLVPMIDARRMEVYSAVYDRSLHEIRGTQADIVEAGTYETYLERGPVYFFGNGATKCKPCIQHPNARFVDNIHPLAHYMYPLAEKAIAQNKLADVAYFEPYYLKEFVATKSKKLL